MVTAAEIGARVAERYDALGLPSWPDPHPGRSEPAEDEYSRVTDPERYRIVHERAALWVEELGTLLDVDMTPVDDGTRVASRRPGTLPLYLLPRDVLLSLQDGIMPMLDIAVGRPDIVVATLPDCGCDACDSGSEDVLTCIDDAVARVIGGPFVVLKGRGWRAEWSPDSASVGGAPSDGVPGFGEAIAICQQLAAGNEVGLPQDTEAYVGHAWFA
ncbi:MAG TPA: DUF6226 family protein [Nocardioides sp.]|nr:DUF6226 family protein [Nocardioides sp.]